jgi:uncharacterized protein
MAPALPDRVDCKRMAAESTVIQREYALAGLPRLADVLADVQGMLNARFAFAGLGGGRYGATVSIAATVHLRCRRCLQAFDHALDTSSAIEFAANDSDVPAESDREFYVMKDGTVSLRELAEEELMLALPIVAACDSPTTCGEVPAAARKVTKRDSAVETTRPFAGLQDLLKKT